MPSQQLLVFAVSGADAIKVVGSIRQMDNEIDFECS